NVKYTIASTSQLLDAKKRDWDWELIEALGFKKSIFPKIIKPGTVRGKLTAEIAEELGVGRIDVIACASHDTASAVVSAPITKDENSCYISCGTWSLLGAELDEPLINEQSFNQNFTNEGGFDNTIRFLKNISGLWLLQETRRQWNREGNNISFKDIDKMLETEHSANIYIDPDFADFATPGNMPLKINDFIKKSGQRLPETKGQLAICILESLAMAYKYYIDSLEIILNTKLDTVHLIGGGVKDKNLCQFTANVTGKRITAGPIEATAIGNITVQLVGKGQLPDMETARKLNSELEIYLPKDTEIWNEKYKAFLKIKR
ncbi:MAG: rhaB, partial [Clostridia bacterium]|nr:rhaB [Clostridia bacterium]